MCEASATTTSSSTTTSTTTTTTTTTMIAATLGPEFQVNVYTPGPQQQSSVAMHADGSFVVVWVSGSQLADVPGDSATAVFLRRFDPAGAPLGDDQQVNTSTFGTQSVPDVTARPGGQFVVVWQSGCNYFIGSCVDGATREVALQRFDGAGTPVGGEQVVNTSVGRHSGPRVASTAGGEFVVAWTSNVFSYPYSTHGITVRRFDADGTPVGDEEQVTGDTSPYDSHDGADVAADAAGNFLVVWAYQGRSDLPAGAQGRRFDWSGTPLGDIDLQPWTGQPTSSVAPAVAALPAGEFVAVWDSYAGSYAQESPGGVDVRGRRFAADGTSVGSDFPVNSHVPGHQFLGAVAADAAGNFVVVWVSGSGQDGDDGGIFAQAFAHDGVPLGGEFQVNLHTSGYQSEPTVSAGPAGDFVITWTSFGVGPAAQDGSDADVFGRTMTLRRCATAAECDDANRCTADACEDDVCLNRRQPGCQ